VEITYDKFLDKVMNKLDWVSEEVDFVYPYTTTNGRYIKETTYPFGWTNGFYGGMIWYLYKCTKDEKYLKLAKKCTVFFDKVIDEFNSLSHDVGFQFLLTSVADAKITGDIRSVTRALHAATILAGRFNTAGGYIKAWDKNQTFMNPDSFGEDYVIIDCLMNLPLLFWASETTKDPRFGQIANLHLDTVIKHFIREDGSANHIVVFNADNGEVIAKPGGQGYKEGSSWSRGQAWAVYGFAMAYHYTKEKKYLDCAQKAAQYFMSHTKEYVPIDFMQPEIPRYEDTSAAAICACGLLEIKKYVSENESGFYASSADYLMKILYKNCDFSHAKQSVLQNCSEMYHREESRHIPLIYGDFYLLEALIRFTGKGDALFY